MCQHTNLQITRKILISHVSDLSQFEDDYEETVISIHWDEADEWQLKESNDIYVWCKGCKKKWHHKNKELFPLWIQSVLDEEEGHFGEK